MNVHLVVHSCCCMSLLMDSSSKLIMYARENTLLAAKGGCMCTPLTPPRSATAHGHCAFVSISHKIALFFISNLGNILWCVFHSLVVYSYLLLDMAVLMQYKVSSLQINSQTIQ